MNVFFTSDTHLMHANVIKHDSRPFDSIEEHDEAIVGNWNDLVGHRDLVYHLGDVVWYNRAKTSEILSRLRGRIILVKGNHDHFVRTKVHAERFEKIEMLMRIKPKVYGREMILCHYPILQWRNKHHGSWHLHGHTHHNGLKEYRKGMCLDVGTNGWSYSPISLERIREEFYKKEINIGL